jgi:hypothetical protein
MQITVNQKDRTLTVSGERKRSSTPTAEADNTPDQQNQQKFRRQFERRMGKFQRTLSGLPDDADLALVSARLLTPPTPLSLPLKASTVLHVIPLSRPARRLASILRRRSWCNQKCLETHLKCR